MARGMQLVTLKRRLREYRANLHDSSYNPPTKHITPLPKPNPANDTEQFNAWLNGLKSDYVSVMHFADIHFPYQHDEALDLAVQLVGYRQPHICVLGSDEFDFMRQGTWDIDPRQKSSELDDIDLIRLDHQRLVDRLIAQSPCTQFVWIFGNHDYRLYRHILKNSPNVANTVMREFVDVIRYQGRVWFMGETDQVKIHNLIVGHGSKSGQNPAKAHLDMTGGQVNYMAGHVHRHSYWQKVGYQYTVQSVTSGCLCQLQPHYKGYRADMTGWEWGTCIGEIKRADDKATALFENLKFDSDNEGRLSARYHGRTFNATAT